MKPCKGVVAVLGIVSILAAVPALAAENPANYFVLKGGVYSPNKDFDVNNITIDTRSGVDGEVAVGHYFLPVFATEFGVGYFESKGTPTTSSGETKLKVVPVTLTAKALLPFGPIEPYGEFGVGAYISKLDVTGNLGSFEGSTKSVFGLHAGVGANVNITQTVFLGAEGRYLWAKPSWGGQDIKMDGYTATIDVGFRF